MRQLVAFAVAGGQTVVAEVDDDGSGVERAGVGELVGRATARLDDAFEQVRTVAELTVSKLGGLAERPETVEVQFGIRLNAEAGAVLARTQAEGHLQITLTWTRLPAAPSADRDA
jgi:hypothetical protein